MPEMTAEDRARHAAETIIEFVPVRRAAGCEPFHPDQMTAIIADAIRAAVAAEREACAELIDRWDSVLGDRIRERGKS